MLEECVPLKPRSYYKRAKMYTIISAQGSKAILPITGYKNLHLGLKLAVALKATTLCFASPCC